MTRNFASAGLSLLLLVGCAASEPGGTEDPEAPQTSSDVAIKSATLATEMLSVSFTGTAAGHECKVDFSSVASNKLEEGDWMLCTSPFQASATADGQYRVYVKSAKGQASKDAIRDEDAPVFLTQQGAETSSGGTFEFTVADAGFFANATDSVAVESHTINDVGQVSAYAKVALSKGAQFDKKGVVALSKSSACSSGAYLYWVEVRATDATGKVTELSSNDVWYCE